MKTFIVTLFLIIASTPILAQNALEAEVKELSKEKWQWMADKNVEELTKLFHKDAQFVHMGGAWGTDRELAIIKSGGIWYKKADIHEVTIDIIGEDTAIVLNRITLLAEVGGNEVTNPFMVTEVYKMIDGNWKLANLSFVKLMERPGN
ncbi:nuclear transport factor 2 family protein [Bizionia sp.]|uniref:nuclear transport factor 2 family protein n=1 Tax=Bizionia sp. TaxID=1954480 RepID=UPI003A9186C2